MPGRNVIRRFLSRRIRDGWMPGAAWWVEGPDGVCDHGIVGHAVIDPAPIPLEDATPFDLASLTKPLCTGLLLSLLEDEKRIDLADPVVEILEELEGTPFEAISAIDLANHGASLPAWRPLYLGACDEAGYLRAIASETSAVPFGETLYSDLGYILLGVLIERVSGQTLAELFHTRIAQPLGLCRLGFPGPARRFDDAAATERGNEYERAMAGDLGRGFQWRRTIPRGEVHDANAHGLGGAAGHAGLFGTAEEVAKVCREILVPRVIPRGASARDRLLRPVGGSTGRTLGMVLAGHSQAARGILRFGAPGHTGFSGTSVWLEPERKSLFVLLTNRVHPVVASRNFQWVRRGFHRLARARLGLKL